MKISHNQSLSAQIKKGLSDKGITMRSLVAFLIFGMIVIVFVLSDLSGRRQGGSLIGSAAEVNGELISIKDFQEEENRLAQYYSQLFGGQFDSGMQRNMLRGEVMNSLITKSVVSQAAEKEGIYATDAEIRHMIVEELPYFKKDGVFQSDAYKAILQANRLTPGEFESKLRQDIKNQRSRQLFESTLGLTQLQKKIENEMRSSKINLQFIRLSSVEFAKHNTITNAEINAALAKEDFKKKVQDDFKLNEALYEVKEQVRAAHILIRSTPQTDAAAFKKAEDILKRASKEDFGKLAEKFSEDPGSKAKKGDLGYFSRGQMVPEFTDAAFGLEKGKISGLVKTSYGYHIIKVLDKKAGSKPNFEEAKMEIAKKFLSNDKYSNFIKSVETKMSSGKADEAVAELLGAKFTWAETGFFSISQEVAPVMNSAQALKVALELTKEQGLAKKLVREGDVQFLIKLKDLKSESIEINSQDQAMLERQKSIDSYHQWVDSFKKNAKIHTNTALMESTP